MALHTDSTALTQFARGQQLAAARVSGAAGSARSDVASLASTFGLIGADFLAALAYVVDNQAQRFDAAASRHQSLSTTTSDADRRYTSTDDTAKRSLEVQV
ncbi:hypothetical protein HH308_07460 [Gordonia sp. TBRC 11910]|uniref:Excreted virulence factor EspC (Type VII ESX diderm) n=1 Tax=Gordonia asplenii TaxID=2725283 RepID=A0A848KXW2_9ACTN|nr:type VII secretion target [Gordonia asplenii]NMO01051.1 hypothetical protein [Gordonia asplenii]